MKNPTAPQANLAKPSQPHGRFLASLGEVVQNLKGLNIELRQGIRGNWEWSVSLQLSGEIKDYANSYSGQTWFVNNAGTVGAAIDDCLAQANLWLRAGERLRKENKQGWIEKQDKDAVNKLTSDLLPPSSHGQ